MPTEVRIPNIGDFTDVPVVELNVKPGDRVEIDTALMVLESDKATVDIPSPLAGTVSKVLVAGTAMPSRMRKGITVQATSTLVLSWKVAGVTPRDLRCMNME